MIVQLRILSRYASLSLLIPAPQTTVIDPSDLGALKKALDEHTVSLFFSESPTNPYLRCVDVRRVSEVRRPISPD